MNTKNKYINPALTAGAISQSKVFLISWFAAMIALVFIYIVTLKWAANLINLADLQNMPEQIVQQILALKNAETFDLYKLSFIDEDNLTLGLIFSAIVAMAALLKDESNNTTEFLFSHPISRKKMYITQLITFLSILLIFSAAFMLASFLLLICFDKFKFSFDVGQFFALHGGALLTNFIFGLLMYGIASNKKGKKYLVICVVTGIALHFSYTIASLLISYLMGKFSWIENLKYLFIYTVIDVSGGVTLNWQPIVIWLVPAVVLNIAGYFRYQKKDLNCA
jgi:ABC-type transport system involved in multi-copper enzyme maturation permease subunit